LTYIVLVQTLNHAQSINAGPCSSVPLSILPTLECCVPEDA